MARLFQRARAAVGRCRGNVLSVTRLKVASYKSSPLFLANIRLFFFVNSHLLLWGQDAVIRSSIRQREFWYLTENYHPFLQPVYIIVNIFFLFSFLFPARGIIPSRSSLRWVIGIPSFLCSLKKLYTGDEELKFVLKYFGWIAQLLLAKDTWLYSTHITIGLSNDKRNCIVDILWLQIPIPVKKSVLS